MSERILLIPDKIITFHGGRPYTSDSPYLSEDEKYSRYEMWINKSNDLPYRMRLKLSYGSSIETCSKVEFNKSRIEDFIPAKYFPSDFTIKERGLHHANVERINRQESVGLDLN